MPQLFSISVYLDPLIFPIYGNIKNTHLAHIYIDANVVFWWKTRLFLHWQIQGGPNSSIFMQFSAKKLEKNNTFGSWRTPLGKILDPPLLFCPKQPIKQLVQKIWVKFLVCFCSLLYHCSKFYTVNIVFHFLRSITTLKMICYIQKFSRFFLT